METETTQNTEERVDQAINTHELEKHVPEGFDWNAKADPAEESGNYFNGTISGELPRDAGESIGKMIRDAFMEDGRKFQSDFINAIPEVINVITQTSGEFSRREMLIAFTGFKMGEIAASCKNTLAGLAALLGGNK